MGLRIHESALRLFHFHLTDANGLALTAVCERKARRHALLHGRRNVSVFLQRRFSTGHVGSKTKAGRAFAVAVVRYGLLLHMLSSTDKIWYDGKNLLWM